MSPKQAEVDPLDADPLYRMARIAQRAAKRSATSAYHPHVLQCWTPNPGPQAAFFSSEVDEVLYGGAAGGGKSASEIALPLRWCNHPRFRALILRRETTQLQDLLDKAADLYPREYPGAEWRGMPELTWTFPSGGVVRFGHCKDAEDHERYHGHEYHLQCWDELTHFLFKQYREVTKRVRSSVVGLPRLVRGATNPGGVGHAWIFKRWAPWLDPECVLLDWTATVPDANNVPLAVSGTGLPPRVDARGTALPPAAGGQALWVVQTQQGERFSSTPVEGFSQRTFIPAKLADNPKLTAADPLYSNKLLDNDPVRVAQLRDGNWLVKPAAGLFFSRSWFEVVDAAPMDGPCARVWDLAATEPSADNPDPDWSCGLLGSKSADGFFYLEAMERFRVGPGEVRARVKATAQADGVEVPQRCPQDPGQAGKDQAASYRQLLEGFDVQTRVVTGSKATRWGVASAQASPHSTGGKYGRIRVVRGDWLDAFFEEIEAVPTGGHDDQADVLADLIAELSDGGPTTVGAYVINGGDDHPRPKALPAGRSADVPPELADFASRALCNAGPFMRSDGWVPVRSALYQEGGDPMGFAAYAATCRACAEAGVLQVRGDGFGEMEIRAAE